ncbi:thioredoxin-like protein [Gonapodya prolifera JEL478]|uniref:Thioredoxin-like protein n=1 Tax=Gonapodya prolifera (strain JEL478) TaxID=1344416 RepID=A0A139AF37_GONPJ|nr:thioredoxin-like protein [Gonapodya prolifera JEL478]|eukprot:KXS15397.1 thioredoxin-like protein [Gonapodya prolifera JEL478]
MPTESTPDGVICDGDVCYPPGMAPSHLKDAAASSQDSSELPGCLAPFKGLVDDQGKPLDDQQIASLRNKVVGLYFSAQWCPPCRAFSPVLSEFLKNHKEEFAVVYVSADNTKEQMMDNVRGKGYWVVPFEEALLRQSLSSTHKITGIPTLVVVDGKTGTAFSRSGRTALIKDKVKAWEEWKEGRCSAEEAGGGAGLSGVTSVVLNLVAQAVQAMVIYWLLKYFFPTWFEGDRGAKTAAKVLTGADDSDDYYEDD